MTKKEAERATEQGSLRRLWAEFTDPGPSGDALVFLKRYLDGIAPGCMGLLFMAVGILVAVLAGKADHSDKRTWVPILFGAVFVLAGFGAAAVGVKTILDRAAARKK